VAPLVWKRPNSIGEGEAIRGMGGIVAPLLAGFCLATIAVLASADPTKTPLAEWSVFCLAISGVTFLYAMQFSFLALRSGSPPSGYVDWVPDAVIRADRMATLRDEQAEDRELFRRYFARAGFFYDVGLLFFLAGLALLMVPAHWHTSNRLAVAAVGLAVAVEFLWFLLSMGVPLLSIGRILNPVRADVRATVKPNVDAIPPEELERMGLRR
jgi:hypothetical protein